MVVAELIRKKAENLITVEASAELGHATRLLVEHRIGGLPVLAGGLLVGFIAERDIALALDRHRDNIRQLSVDRVMRRPAPTCSGDETLQNVMARMTRERLRHLVVLDGDRPMGVISVGDLVKQRLEQLETETGVLRDLVAAKRAAT